MALRQRAFRGAAAIEILHGRRSETAPRTAQDCSAGSFGNPIRTKTFSPKGSKLFWLRVASILDLSIRQRDRTIRDAGRGYCWVQERRSPFCPRNGRG
ncbi:MAG: hypothetical protein WCD18_17430 [Thermosynechococcaceae cyanobacterium]